MKPIEFKEQNRLLTKPKNMTDKQCGSLPVRADEGVCTSCWKMTFKERLNAILFGRIWVSVLTGTATQPPVSIQCEKSIFKKEAK
jgi:hypothetical protein